MGIMDSRTKRSLSEDTMSEDNKKLCSDCKTTKTPLWRGGPAGPKSLCNACGIRYMKKRREMMGLNKGLENNKKKETSSSSSSHSSQSQSSSIGTKNGGGGGGDDDDKKVIVKFNGLSETVKMRLYALGSDILLQRSSASGVVRKQRCQRRRKLGEEELAAISLMALSCGTVFCLKCEKRWR